MELKYFFFGKFNEDPSYFKARFPQIINTGNNLPASTNAHAEYLKVWSLFCNQSSELHFYHLKDSPDKADLYLYCLPKIKSEIENKFSKLYNDKFDSIHFWHSRNYLKDYNFWMSYDKNPDNIFMLIIGLENMIRMYNRTIF